MGDAIALTVMVLVLVALIFTVGRIARSIDREMASTPPDGARCVHCRHDASRTRPALDEHGRPLRGVVEWVCQDH